MEPQRYQSCIEACNTCADACDYLSSASSVPTLFEQDQLLIENVLDVVGYGLCK
jgi:hypothetical protein